MTGGRGLTLVVFPEQLDEPLVQSCCLWGNRRASVSEEPSGMQSGTPSGSRGLLCSAVLC